MNVVLRDLGSIDYEQAWHAMQNFTRSRSSSSDDELWAVEHPAIFTQGRAGKSEHLLAPGEIPVVNSDRGGQVTYHGPGQLVLYTLLNVKRLGIGPRELVRRLEQSLIDYLDLLGIAAERRAGAPGVYVGAAKVAALGLRIRNGYSYHGIALNIAMDLEPFSRINPCGYAGLAVTQLSDLGGPADVGSVIREFVPIVTRHLYGDLPFVLEYTSDPTCIACMPQTA
ncbi:MAG: lipoyl(octanoyl) transferase LipB [Proteobacteria bacterium]|nr:lipoyl(octanoyl) transferase LipB [Pseudomonadota bacterium]